jgi:hypothetical protein
VLESAPFASTEDLQEHKTTEETNLVVYIWRLMNLDEESLPRSRQGIPVMQTSRHPGLSLARSPRLRL